MMGGATVAHARSVHQLQEDLLTIRPTILISVPRIYERIYAGIRAKLAEGSALSRKLFKLAVEIGYSRFEYQQGRAPRHDSHHAVAHTGNTGGEEGNGKTGRAAARRDERRGRVVERCGPSFIGLGLPVLQGYGMTESSPVVCCNTQEDNVPASVGRPIPGVEVKLGEHNALLIRGPNVMLGYWNNPEATKAVLISRMAGSIRAISRVLMQHGQGNHYRPPEGNYCHVYRQKNSSRGYGSSDSA